MRCAILLLWGIAVLICFLTPVHAALQYEFQEKTGESYFTVDSIQMVYVDVRKKGGTDVAIKKTVISSIGWFYFQEVLAYRQGKRTELPELHYGDMETGALGEFYPNDKIVFWIETVSADGKKETFSMFSPSRKDQDLWLLGTSGENINFNWGKLDKESKKNVNPSGFYFSLSTNARPARNPLPGIIATLIVGIGTFLYLKNRKKFYPSA